MTNTIYNIPSDAGDRHLGVKSRQMALDSACLALKEPGPDRFDYDVIVSFAREANSLSRDLGVAMSHENTLIREIHGLRRELEAIPAATRSAIMLESAVGMLAKSVTAEGAAKNYVTLTMGWDPGITNLPFRKACITMYRDGAKAPSDVVTDLTAELAAAKALIRQAFLDGLGTGESGDIARYPDWGAAADEYMAELAKVAT